MIYQCFIGRQCRGKADFPSNINPSPCSNNILCYDRGKPALQTDMNNTMTMTLSDRRGTKSSIELFEFRAALRVSYRIAAFLRGRDRGAGSRRTFLQTRNMKAQCKGVIVAGRVACLPRVPIEANVERNQKRRRRE